LASQALSSVAAAVISPLPDERSLAEELAEDQASTCCHGEVDQNCERAEDIDGCRKRVPANFKIFALREWPYSAHI